MNYQLMLKFLQKSFEGFHAVFNIDVSQGDIYCRGADVGVAKDTYLMNKTSTGY